MKYQYIKSFHQEEENINLCTQHAIQINERDNLVARNPLIDEVENCIVCDNEISLEDLIQSLE